MTSESEKLDAASGGQSPLAATSSDPGGPPARRLRAVLVGAGSLGKALLRRLLERQDAPIDLVAVATQRHGVLIDRAGIDPERALRLVQSTGLGDAPGLPRLLSEVAPDLLIECIPQNIRAGEPALGYLRSALSAGIHVITSNKAPVALAYPELRELAEEQGVSFLFGATVLDGLPVFSLPQLAGDAVVKLRGVFNATSSIVLETVQDGKSRARGLARAQAQGIAEADPVLDLDGWDAAAKLALLSNVWMGGRLRVVDVAREGVEGLKDSALRAQAEEGLKLRLVAEASRGEDGVLRAGVRPELLGPEDPLYGLTGGRGGLVVETASGGSYTLLQRRYGVIDAADGIIRDCYQIASAR